MIELSHRSQLFCHGLAIESDWSVPWHDAKWYRGSACLRWQFFSIFAKNYIGEPKNKRRKHRGPHDLHGREVTCDRSGHNSPVDQLEVSVHWFSIFGSHVLLLP